MIDATNEFQYFHTYAKLAKAGHAPFLLCSCGAKYATLSEDYRLVLWCPVEDYTVTPGELTLHNVEQAVNYFKEK